MQIRRLGNVTDFHALSSEAESLLRHQLERFGKAVSLTASDDIMLSLASPLKTYSGDEGLHDIVEMDKIANIGAVAIQCQRLARAGAFHHIVEYASIGID